MSSNTNGKLSKGQRCTVHIDRLAVGGKGVARLDGLVIFVANTAPGDDVEVEITLLKKNFAEAELLRIISPANVRVQPPCPVAGVCGGCSWQHISYAEQLVAKRNLIIESLLKFSGYTRELETLVLPTVPSPKEFRYRNRIQLQYGKGQIGFFRRNSHDIVNISDCPITDERLASQIPILAKELAAQPGGRVEIYITEAGETARRQALVPGNHDETVSVTGPAFAQVNTEQNENLVAYVVRTVGELLNDKPDVGQIYDLYAGSGNFTFPLAHAFAQVGITGVELNAESVALAVARGQRYYSDDRIKFQRASVDEFVETHNLGGSSLVVLDPPRTGCGPNVMSHLAAQKPSSIVYISCHPATLARDLKPLAEQGYKLVSVQPFDMFPQTDHVETAVLLSRPR